MAYETSLAIILVGAMWFFAILAMNTNDEHPILKLLYILFGFASLIAGIGLGLGIATENSAPTGITDMLAQALRLGIIGGLLVTFYYMWYTVKWVIMKIVEKMSFKKDSKFNDYQT